MTESKGGPPATQSSSSSVHHENDDRRDSDSEPMVHFTPIDFAAVAREERDRLIAQGTDPDSIIFMSEFSRRFPQQESESNQNFSHRRSTTMKAMVADNVTILNDQGNGNRVPDRFPSKDGRYFDLGPESGVTKGEYREFTEWFYKVWRAEEGQVYEVPERWLKFVRLSGSNA